MRLTKFCKRALCFSLAVLILFLSPVSSYLDSKKTYEVNATGLEAGLLTSMVSGSAALIGALLPSMGVSNMSTKDLDILDNDFEDWLELYADSGLIVGGTTANNVLDILYDLKNTIAGDTSPIITIANDAAQVSNVASALYTFLSSVFSYDSKNGTISSTGGYSSALSWESVPSSMISDDVKSYLLNYDSTIESQFNSYFSSKSGLFAFSATGGRYSTSGYYCAFAPIDLGSLGYDAAYLSGKALYLYNYGDIANAVSLWDLTTTSGSDIYNGDAVKFYYSASYDSYYFTTPSDYEESTLQSFFTITKPGTNQYSFKTWGDSLYTCYYIGVPFPVSASLSDAIQGIYTTWEGFSLTSDIDIESDFAVDSSSMVDTAPYQDNTTSISFNNVDIYEIAEAAVAAAVAANPDLTDAEQQAIFVQAVSDALAVSATYDEAVDDTDEESTVYVPTTINPAASIDASDIEDATEALNQQSVSNTNSIISGLQAIVNTIVDLPSLIADALGLSSFFAVLYGYLSNTLASVQSIPRYISDVADMITDTFSGLDSLLQSLLSGVTDALYAQTQSLADAIADTFPGLDDTLTGISSSISDMLTGITVGLPDAIGDVLEKSSIPGSLSNVLDILTGIPLSIANYIEEVLDGLTIPAFLTDIIDGIAAIPAAVAEAIGTLDIPGAIVGAVEGIGELIISIPDTITVALSSAWDLLWEWLQKIIDAILSVPDTIVATLEDIISTIIAIPADIINLLSALLETLFVPSSYAITDEISELRSGFPFIDTIITVYEDIISIFEEDADPPVIYIDLSAATSENFKYGDMIALVDFSWYADYKKYGDDIISAFLWLVFLWRLMLNLPSIIQGGSIKSYGFTTDSESGELRAEVNELHIKRG